MASTPFPAAQAAPTATLAKRPPLTRKAAKSVALVGTPPPAAQVAPAVLLASPRPLAQLTRPHAKIVRLTSSLRVLLRRANTPRTPTRDAAVIRLKNSMTFRVQLPVQRNAKQIPTVTHSSSRTIGAK